MKSFLKILAGSLISTAVLFLFTFGVVYYYNPEIYTKAVSLIEQPCAKPITYKIGSFDTRYGFSEGEFKEYINQAADIWKDATERQLYKFDTNGKITINLIYDVRQELESQVTSLENQLTDKKEVLTPSRTKYAELVANFKKKIADLNSEINDWNSKGGAPVEIYASLIKRQDDLKAEAEKINELAKQLNLAVADYNANVGKLKQTANELSETIHEKPEQGTFDGRNMEINIYLNTGEAEFVHTLAHELGHAIGLIHVANPKAIMYPFTTKTTVASNDDINDIKTICNSTLLDRVRSALTAMRKY